MWHSISSLMVSGSLEYDIKRQLKYQLFKFKCSAEFNVIAKQAIPCNGLIQMICTYSTHCNELQEQGRNVQIVLCNKETKGGALIETIFHCSWTASGRKRGKHLLSHMECYNGTRLKTAMNNCILALMPAGHSSFSPNLLLWEFTFFVYLSISKCSWNEYPLRQLCNNSRNEVSLHTSTVHSATKRIAFP